MRDRVKKTAQSAQPGKGQQTSFTSEPSGAGHESEDPTIPPVASPDEITTQSPPPVANQPMSAADFVLESSQAMAIPPELRNHPDYEVIRQLGRGGMGVVYLAKNRIMGRLEVLKVISPSLMDRPQMVERFLQEIRSAAQLNHSNIVTAYTALRFGDLLVLAMEYVEGENLVELIKRRGPLPVLNACYYIQQAAQGLQHALDKGMVHRDIKPSNLMLARAGKRHTVKILDFGLAKATREKATQAFGDAPQEGLTIEGIMLGTPEFVAPEQILDARKADIRADIYSLGCTLYYLLAGRAPFRGSSIFQVLQGHQTSKATPLNKLRADVPAELAAVVDKMLAKEPARRYQRPLEVIKALAPFVKPAAPVLAPTRPPVPAKKQAIIKTAATSSTSTLPHPSRPPSRPNPLSTDRTSSASTEADVWEDLADVTPLPTSEEKKWPFQSERFHLWFWPTMAVGLALLLVIGLWVGGAFRSHSKQGVSELTDLRDHSAEENNISRPISAPKRPAQSESPGQARVDSDPVPHEGFEPLFNGKDLSDWSLLRDDGRSWRVVNGHIVESSGGWQTAGVLYSNRQFSNYRLRLEYKLDPGALCRFVPRFRQEDTLLKGDLFQAGLGLVDDEYFDSHPEVGRPGARTGAFLASRDGVNGVPRDQPASLNPSGWNVLEVELRNQVLSVKVNAQPVQRIHLDFLASRPNAFFGLKQTRAPIGLSGHTGTARFRNIEIMELPDEAAAPHEPAVLAVLSHRPGLGNPGHIRLLANGHVNSPNHPDTWELQGNKLIFRWVNKNAPGGAWVDTCTITDNGRTYSGANQNRTPVSGANLSDGDLIQLLRRTREKGEPTAPSSGNFVSLFNGKDLTGWKTHPKQPGNWRVENGILIGSGPRSHLYSARGDYQDFHVRVEARINDGGNSGVYFRALFGPAVPVGNPGQPLGYEAQINSTHHDANKTGSLYAAADGAVVSLRKSPVPPGEWFTQEVIARGNHLVIKLNGRTTADYTDDKRLFTSGHFALQVLPPQTVVEFRKIEIQEFLPTR